MKKYYSMQYFINRYYAFKFEKSNMDKPWLNRNAIFALDGLLKNTDFFVECGSGRSTIWFAAKVKYLLSIEHDKPWYEEVKKNLELKNVQNVEYYFAKYTSEGHQTDNEYIQKIKSLKNDSVDGCLIDGGPRSYCALEMIPKLKRNGYLIIDDAENFLPSSSISPNALRDEKEIPKLWKGFMPLTWIEVYKETKNWRRIWTSDGVKDTCILVKP